MTRKRFVKLLMSAEVQRNDSEAIAALLPPRHSYQELFMFPDIWLTVRMARFVKELRNGSGGTPLGMVADALIAGDGDPHG